MIFDEVFTGLYRLGRHTAASFLGVDADIAVNAKLLTGGLVPLCTTTASQAIFDAFSSSEKTDALLHGHSYTAHAVGCQVAVDSLRRMESSMAQGSGSGSGPGTAHWEVYQKNWGDEGEGVWSMWSPELVRDLSGIDSVEGIFALGTVLSMALKDTQGGGTFHSVHPPSLFYKMIILYADYPGYNSNAARGLQQKLAASHVHSRVLGNVLYVMASLTSTPASVQRMEELLRASM